MPKICYQSFNFRYPTLKLIEQCNDIIAEYIADDLKLTLRQLYYQLVSRDVIPNTLASYNKLGNTVNDARLAGMIDWNSIEDRTRNLASIGHWSSPENIIAACANSYHVDKWEDQPCRPEVWIEKEALAGVFERACFGLDVPYLSCRGYTSQSEMWGAAMRYVPWLKSGKRVCIFHFGDHDPSGIDMTRDIEDRLRLFVTHHVGLQKSFKLQIKRIALNMDQVEQYNPPENPAKVTDTRFANYEAEFGDKSWELDALNPRTLTALVRDEILAIRDQDLWNDQIEREANDRAQLKVVSDNWEPIALTVEKLYETELSDELTKQRIDLRDAETD